MLQSPGKSQDPFMVEKNLWFCFHCFPACLITLLKHNPWLIDSFWNIVGESQDPQLSVVNLFFESYFSTGSKFFLAHQQRYNKKRSPLSRAKKASEIQGVNLRPVDHMVLVWLEQS